MYISGAGLSSLIHVRAECKIKDPDLSDSTQSICASCNCKFKRPEFKHLAIKSTKNVIILINYICDYILYVYILYVYIYIICVLYIIYVIIYVIIYYIKKCVLSDLIKRILIIYTCYIHFS